MGESAGGTDPGSTAAGGAGDGGRERGGAVDWAETIGTGGGTGLETWLSFVDVLGLDYD